MSVELRIAAVAELHLQQALAWWSEHRRDAEGVLAGELERAFHRVVSQPEIGVPDLESSGVRCVVLRRSRYRLYYRVVNDSLIEVLALWHSSRGSDPPLPSA